MMGKWESWLEWLIIKAFPLSQDRRKWIEHKKKTNNYTICVEYMDSWTLKLKANMLDRH